MNYDDPDYVTENALVQKGLTIEGLKWAFRNTEASNWHPLTRVSHMADCQFYGLRPFGHHLTSVLFHALNTVLLFLVLRKMAIATGCCFAIALIFGLHPLRVESVAWIAERKDVLSTFFWLLTIWAYAKYVAASGVKTAQPKVWYGATIVLFACGLLSKAMLVTAPFLLLLLDYWPLNRWPGKKAIWLVIEKLPLFALAMAMSSITYVAQQDYGAVSQTLPLAARIQNAVVSYCRYIGKAFWPSDLCVCYPHPGHWPIVTVLASSLILISVTILVCFQARKRPYLMVGWFWYLGTLVPVIGLVQVGQQAMADRYTYFPTIGILLMVIVGLGELVMNRLRKTYPVLPWVGIAAVVLCIGATSQQIRYWKDSESLFRQGVTVTQNNSLAHGGLARALVDKGELGEAIVHYQEAIRLRPNDTIARNGLGSLLVQKGLLDEGIYQFQEALKVKPDDPITQNNLGMSLARKGQFGDAIPHFREAVRLKPNFVEAHSNLGGAFAAKGLFDEAIVHFQEVVRLNPNNAEARNTLGLALIQKKQLDQAIIQFQEAIRIKPEFAKAQRNLAAAIALREKNKSN